MKYLLVVIMAFFSVSAHAVAQTPAPQNISQEKWQDKKDCVMLIDGEMFVIKDGKKTAMTKAVIMSNGTKVLANGEVFLKDGESFKLSNGDCVYMSGKVEKKNPNE